MSPRMIVSAVALALVSLSCSASEPIADAASTAVPEAAAVDVVATPDSAATAELAEPAAPDATSEPTVSVPTSTAVAVPTEAATPQPPAISASDPSAFRVRSDLVRADVAEPYLELHSGPGVETPTIALLPPWYSQLTATGREELAPNGRPWIEVELVDWIDGERVGWVNAAYVEANSEGVAVTSAEVEPCSAPTIEPISTPSLPDAGPDLVVRSIDSFQYTPECLRVVVTLADADDILRVLSDEHLWTFIHGDVVGGRSGASGAGLLLDSAGSGVHLVRESGRFGPARFDLWSSWRGLPHVSVHPERSAVVLDYPTSAPGERYIAPDGQWMWPFGVETGPGWVKVTGIDRPFEANLVARIVAGTPAASDAGLADPVTATYSGSWYFGTTTTDGYAVQTSDYLTAAAPFALRADGLEPGVYSLILGEDMGEGPPPVPIPFEIIEPGPTPAPAIDERSLDAVVELRRFAAGLDSASPQFASSVEVLLMDKPYTTLSRTEARDRNRWTTEFTEFAQFVGEFDVLAPLVDTAFPRLRTDATVACGNWQLDWPESFSDHHEVWMEPLVLPNQSCIDWWANTVFLNDDGEIAAVSLLAFGP